MVRRDYPVVLGTLYLFTLIGLVVKLIGDLCYVVVDPRVQFDSLTHERVARSSRRCAGRAAAVRRAVASPNQRAWRASSATAWAMCRCWSSS